MLLFVTGKRLDLFQDCQVKLSVSGSLINTSTCYKYMYLGVHLDPSLNFETHFQNIYQKAAGRVNLLRRIRSTIVTFSVQTNLLIDIMPIFTYCCYISLGWSESRKRMIRSIEHETRSLEIIQYPKCSPQNKQFYSWVLSYLVFECKRG